MRTILSFLSRTTIMKLTWAIIAAVSAFGLYPALSALVLKVVFCCANNTGYVQAQEDGSLVPAKEVVHREESIVDGELFVTETLSDGSVNTRCYGKKKGKKGKWGR